MTAKNKYGYCCTAVKLNVLALALALLLHLILLKAPVMRNEGTVCKRMYYK